MSRSAGQGNNLKKNREAARVSVGLEKRLLTYAAAASAAGVGILASGQFAEAKIVYTPANKHINVNGGIVDLDLNHDGITDVIFKAVYYHSGKDFVGSLWLAPSTELGGAVKVASLNLYWAAALPKGHKVGPKAPFLTGTAEEPMAIGNSVSTLGSYSGGPWRSSAKRGYIGLKFAIKGKVHFGWIRLERVAAKKFKYPAVITGYAYETIPGKAIFTGQTKDTDDAEAASPSLNTHEPGPATLGALSLGAPGLSIWRREQSSTQR
jgi:hypothetical protein